MWLFLGTPIFRPFYGSINTLLGEGLIVNRR
jgi:hypothetical protein